MAKTYQVYINAESAAFVTSENSTWGADVPDLYLGDNAIWQATVFKADGSAFEFPPDAVFFVSLNALLGADDPDEAAAVNDSFNDTDHWAEVSLAGGKICWELNTSTEDMETYLAAAANKKIWMELWYKASADSNYSKILHERLTIHNSGSDFDPVETEGLTYATTDDLTAAVSALATIHVDDFASLPADPDDGTERYIDAYHYLATYSSITGSWHNPLGGVVDAEG